MESPTMKLTKVIIRAASLIDSIQFVFSDGIKTTFTKAYGGKGGFEQIWFVQDSDEISKI